MLPCLDDPVRSTWVGKAGFKHEGEGIFRDARQAFACMSFFEETFVPKAETVRLLAARSPEG
jgi:hypothetical protein